MKNSQKSINSKRHNFEKKKVLWINTYIVDLGKTEKFGGFRGFKNQ